MLWCLNTSLLEESATPQHGFVAEDNRHRKSTLDGTPKATSELILLL